MDITTWQWILVIGFSLILFLLAPYSKTGKEFFKATKKDKRPGFWMLCSSLVISWIFAKSITNAANLGMAFGFVGGFAYATYYLSFLVAGFVLYKMRVNGGIKSIHEFLQNKFGRGAVILFSVLIAFRLFNEIWSNTMVIGSYFGDAGSSSYYWAIIAFTLLTLAYSLKGGLRSSLMTDMIQMALFGVLLFFILAQILPAENMDVVKFVESGEWKMAAGLNLFFVALIQVFSYPFHDPVLTDRAFLSDPKTTLKSFIWATPIGFICILLFSFVGIFGQFQGLSGQAPVEVAKLFGVGMMLMINFIMITSAASTLDSTFASFSKLVTIDLSKNKTLIKNVSVSKGRLAMAGLALLGTIPVFMGAEILSATTVSGTMVIGLAPVFILWKIDVPTPSFYLSVILGIIFGVILSLGLWPEILNLSSGKYGDLLSVNIIGTILCFTLYLSPKFLAKR